MNPYDRKYIETQLSIINGVDKIYSDMVDNVVATLPYGLSSTRLFYFRDHPRTRKEVDRIINACSVSMLSYINTQAANVWKLANTKNDVLVDRYVGNRKITPQIDLKKTNQKQLQNFLTSKTKGLTISDRVWNTNANLRKELESAVSAAIESGQSAKELAKNIKKYLKEPDKRFRRIRDKFDRLTPSSNALSYHSGQGVYRSSQANALRLARTEINKAYRTAENLRWQQFPFVTGFEIKNSNRVYTVCELCKEKAGKYPKTFMFVGWHPNCLCYCIPILMPQDEFFKALRG